MPKATAGTELRNQIFSGGTQRATPEIVRTVRVHVSEACEEILDIGARIRPLMVGDARLGWVRGLHITERKILARWCVGTEFLEQALLLATSLGREELACFTTREIFNLVRLVKQMTDFDLSLAPYMTAFATTSVSEFLWHGKGLALTSFENRVVRMPDGGEVKIMSPSHHAKLWASLCTYRTANKLKIDGMMNAAMIVRPWVRNAMDPFVAELRVSARNLEVDAIEPWESVVSTHAVEVDDGWGHPDDTREGLLRELHGMLAHDKHEQVMDAFMRQQIRAAEAEQERIARLQKKRGGPGVYQKEGVVVLTPAEVRKREQQMKKGVPVRETEIAPTAAERIVHYK